MISIIISSYKPGLFSKLAENIKETIGNIEYEIIRIHNPGLMGICAAYNKGAAAAKYPYLCFVHEDVCFNTNDWGKRVADHFNSDEQLGLIGVAGSNYKSYAYSGLGSTWGNANLRMHIIQTGENGSQHLMRKSVNANIEQVLLVDGCFMCTTAKVFSNIQFDEKTFRGFHCYDIDFSLSVNQSFKAAVVYDILIEHFSAGGFNKEWLDETYKLHKKWKAKIPYSLHTFSKREVYNQEAGAYYFLLNTILKLKYGLQYFLQINFSRKLISLVGPSKWLWMQVKLPNYIFRYLIKKQADKSLADSLQ